MSDLIERDKAIAKTFCTTVDGVPRMVVLLDDIKAIPSARPQGEWVHLKGDEWLCSNCGYVVWTDEELERIIHDAKKKHEKKSQG